MANKQDKVSTDYRKHITAAKAWLGQAEESIDKDNEIRSDLNLMLAQAELQRAKERDDVKLWKKWLRWTVPWIAAIAVAVGYIFVLRGEEAQDTTQLQPVMKEQTGTVNVSEHNVEDLKQSSTGEHVEVYRDNSLELSDKLQSDKMSSHEAEIVEESKVVKSFTAQDDEEKSQSNIPAEDMQRLMQSAGRTLRE